MSYVPITTAVLVMVVLLGVGSRWLHSAATARETGGQPQAPADPAPTLVVSTLAGQPPRPTYADGQGAAARFWGVGPMALDGYGNLYVAENAAVRKITPAGYVSTLAGEAPARQVLRNGSTMTLNGDSGFSDGQRNGQGSAARFSGLAGIAVAPDGTVFVSQSNTIRRISSQGDVTTWAGQPGRDGGGHRDGPGAQAIFNRPTSLVLDGHGTLYVSDTNNKVIRQISSAGVVSTLAGKPGARGTANGPGEAARFENPGALALAPDGALLVADVSSRCIRRVTPRGEVSTWAGQATNTFGGTWPGVGLKFDVIQSLAVDRAGTVYVLDAHNTIRRILADRTEPAYPWAGNEEDRSYRDAPTPAAARFDFPRALAVGPGGTLYVADFGNKSIRTIGADGRVGTLAGEPPRATLDGLGPAAEFDQPSGVAVDQTGHVFVADYNHNMVRRIDAAGRVSILAGRELTGQPFGTDKGDVFFKPTGVGLGPDGTLYVVDEQHAVLKVSPQGKVTLLAGQPGIVAGDNDDGLLSKARFNHPSSVAVAPDGTVYVSDRESGAIRHITPGGRVSTFSSGRRTRFNPFSDEGHVSYSVAVAVGPDGAVYVLRGTLRKYLPSGREIELAGDPHQAGYADGRGAQARFNHPTGLAVDAQGNVFIADRGNHLIRRVSPQGEVTTMAGQPAPVGAAGLPAYYAPDSYYGGDAGLGDYRDGPAAQARFNHPRAVAVGADGTLYVADQDNNCIRVIKPDGAAHP